MSRHRIVHTFNANDIVSEFDGDDYEDEVEDELSPEDRQAMEEGTAEVRRALGTEANKVTKAQIEEALWHYYYDIDKSVTYLMKTFIAPAPKPAKKAPEGMSVFFSASQRLFGTGADHRRLPTGHTSIMDLPPALGVPAWHFDDMPWMSVPEERRAVFIEPERPRGGLLGGGEGPPKMSKLQALAAARKKKTEEKKELERAGKGLERLSINEPQKENQPILGQVRQAPETTLQVKSPPQEESTEVSTITDNQKYIDSTPKGWLMDEDLPVMMPRAAPSAFARTLFGSAPSKVPRPDEIFAMPYTSSPIYVAEAFAEPSPDDVVLAAQAKAGKKPVAKAPKKAQKEKDKDVSLVEKDVAELNVVEAPPPKSKGLDVLKEYENSSNKRSISFVVVGHVDAGKSTLMGRLLLELKFVEKHTIDRYRKQAEKSGKQSFALAWVMDQRSEERERGVTIDIATNHFETEKTSFTILDAPGHRDFVPNMIAGASQADFAILVIDANTGAYEKGLKGQTREHVFLLRSLGVQRLVIAVNKLDMVGWSQERFDEIAQQVNAFLAGLGFQPKNIDFIPISGLNGDNLVRRTEDKAASWYTGPTLIEALENSEPSTTRALRNPFRMAISEVFRSQLGTTTIAGRVDSGSVQIGDALLVQPSGEEAYVKSIMVDSGMQDWAVAGQSVSVALTNIDPIHIRVGDMLCHTKDPISCGDTFTMKAMAFEHLMPMPVDLHRGRLHSAGQIVSITATLDKATGAIVKKKPRVVQPGGVARVVIKLAAKVPLESGQRVVIRSGGETVAAGLLE
ncbi:elongation factor 1-alpha [Fusarium circinatum]|uniref:Elongation factor 1 alpha-like protein n=1 Tax=Fusarium circinatum TaxID=48490 RepID=A0A8H5WWB3_FUSCI|nr:elongation factor 1-alpha [Fusarium circinatum]